MTDRRFTFSLLLLSLFAGSLFLPFCRTAPTAASRQNYATYYKTEEKMLRPKYAVYNVTDSMSRLYFMISSSDLLYVKNNGEESYSARILVSYLIHPVEFSKIVIDSGHVVMNDVAKPGEIKQLAGTIDMDVVNSGNYYLEIAFRDLNKATLNYSLVYLDHKGSGSRNNFLATHKESDVPLFRNYVDSGETFTLHYYKPGTATIYARYFSNTAGPAPPPYALDMTGNALPQPDSTWMVDLLHNPDITLKKEGWYLFSTDLNSKTGYMIARFHQGFPEVTVARQLLYPLRYLTMKQEYMKMDTAANIKHAVDEFWLSNSGSEERARELIRNYYNRVGAANTLFSTEKEGWKTDRGMIYLLFGPPSNVYRNAITETWIYSNDVGGGGLNFIFQHVPDAPSDQDFIMERSPNYKPNWITAVDAWRQGHVYTLH